MTLAYPHELDAHARARVEAKLAQAERSFAEDARASLRSGPMFQTHRARASVPARRVVLFVLEVFEAFLWELTAAVEAQEQDWTAERFRVVTATFLDLLIESVYQRKQAGKVLGHSSDDIDDREPLALDGFRRRVYEELARFGFWTDHHHKLQALAERETKGKPLTTARVLRALTAEMGWTVVQVAENVNLSELSVKRHLAGKATPRDSNLRAYAAAFSQALGGRSLCRCSGAEKLPRKIPKRVLSERVRGSMLKQLMESHMPPTGPQQSTPINLPPTGFVRLPTVLSVIPVGRSTWWYGVKIGRYPKPCKLGPGVTAWRVEDIRALIEKLSAGSEGDR